MAKKARRVTTQTTGAAPARVAPAQAPRDPDAWTEKDRRYWPVAGALFLFGFALRVFRLDAAVFQHDEAIYSIFSLNFHDYNFDPVYHGPTLYHIVKAMFSMFGDSDFTARMVSVIMGLITFGMILGPVRRYMGPRAALFALALHVISPVMVTYQRRILFDAWVVVLTFASVLYFHRTRITTLGSNAWIGAWVGLVAILSTFLATKANAFFVIAMLGSFWVMERVRHIGPRHRLPTQVPLLMFAAVSIASICALRNENKTRNEAMLAVVGVVASAVLWEWLRQSGEARASRKAPAPAEETPKAPLPIGRIAACAWLSLLVGGFLYAFFFGHGYLWWQNPPEMIARYWPDIRDAMKKMLDYWGGQQKTPRLPGRHDFYLPLMMAYELPILVAFIGGVVRASRQRTPFTDLLLWWCFTSWTLYAMANEKVPWLMTHLVAPFAILAGWWLAQLQPRGAGRKAFAAACAVGAVFLLRNVSATNYERAIDNREPMFYAFTAESFKDTFFHAVDIAKTKTGDVWIYNAWPPSWYMRPSAFGGQLQGAAIHYPEHDPPLVPYRMVVCMEQDWEKYKNDRLAGWHKWTWENGGLVRDGRGENPHILNWPRLSWSSFRPDLFIPWFLFRKAEVPDLQNPQRATFLTEWSHIPVIVATPP